MGKRRKLHEFTAENDIRYRGPLSYQGFQVLGWMCIVATVYCLLLRLTVRLNPASAGSQDNLITVLSYVTSMSLPFLLIANFAKILNNEEGYKKQLIKNGGAALGIMLVSTVYFSRYVVSLISQFVTDPENVVPVMTEAFRAFKKEGFVAFNLFTDLFLCTLFMFFLNARPARILTGKKRYILRFLAVLPIAYEVCSMILKGQAAAGEIMLPLWAFPLLTVKPPMTFVVFVVLALYIKTRELRFRRHGKTHGDYQAFLKTNRNSLHFSVFLCVSMVIAAIIDFIILLYLMAVRAPSVEALSAADVTTAQEYASVALAMGFGTASVPLLFASPFVLLFSYTRIPKNKRISLFIPLTAIAVIVLLLIEAVYQGIGSFALQTQHVPIRELFDQMMSGAWM